MVWNIFLVWVSQQPLSHHSISVRLFSGLWLGPCLSVLFVQPFLSRSAAVFGSVFCWWASLDQASAGRQIGRTFPSSYCWLPGFDLRANVTALYLSQHFNTVTPGDIVCSSSHTSFNLDHLWLQALHVTLILDALFISVSCFRLFWLLWIWGAAVSKREVVLTNLGPTSERVPVDFFS